MLVLTYHSISDGPPPLCVAADELGRHLDTLEEAGYAATTLAALSARLESGEAPDERGFLVTFDDGYRDFGDAAWPLLRARGVRPVLFAVASSDRDRLAGGIGAPLLPLPDLRSLADEGVDIGAHSVAHVDLRGLGDTELEAELRQGRALLEDLTGRQVDSFAYPFGAYDERVRAAATRHYRSAFTTQLAALRSGCEPSALPRIDAFYLSAPWLRDALRGPQLDAALTRRRWLRRLRGSEPRLAIPRR